MDASHKASVLNRLKTVRGHLDGVIRMVEAEEYCVDLMKQVSALQASLERANRLILQNHLQTCFTGAVSEGQLAAMAGAPQRVDAIERQGYEVAGRDEEPLG